MRMLLPATVRRIVSASVVLRDLGLVVMVGFGGMGERVSLWIGEKSGHALDRDVDLTAGHLCLLGDRVRDDGDLLAREEVQDAIVDGSEADAKFVDAVSEQIGLRAAKLVAESFETLQADHALGEGLFLALAEVLEEVEDW